MNLTISNTIRSCLLLMLLSLSASAADRVLIVKEDRKSYNGAAAAVKSRLLQLNPKAVIDTYDLQPGLAEAAVI